MAGSVEWRMRVHEGYHITQQSKWDVSLEAIDFLYERESMEYNKYHFYTIRPG